MYAFDVMMLERFVSAMGLSALLFSTSGCGSDSETDASGGAAGTGGAAGAGGTAGSDSGGSAGSGGASGSGGGADAGPCTLASSWELVDDYVKTPGQPSNTSAITVDSKGNVYAVGLARDAAAFGGVVRKSSDGGATWTDVDWPAGTPGDAAADDAGNVYVIAGMNGRVVRKSADAGASWSDVEVIPMTGGPNEPCNFGFIAAGPNGVVVAGASCDSSGWVVRKSVDSAKTWSHAFSFQLAAGKTARMEDVGIDSDGKVYATGQAVDGADATHWVTVSEGASTGVVSDDFQLASGVEAHGRGFSSRGTTMVAGFASDGATTYGIVRKLTGTDQWQTLYEFPTRASDVEAAGENLVVAGTLEEGGTNRAVTRVSADSGSTWNIIDEYAYVAGKNTGSGTLAADPRGNVYAAFIGVDASDVNHWLVRKLSCR